MYRILKAISLICFLFCLALANIPEVFAQERITVISVIITGGEREPN